MKKLKRLDVFKELCHHIPVNRRDDLVDDIVYSVVEAANEGGARFVTVITDRNVYLDDSTRLTILRRMAEMVEEARR